MFLLTVLLYCFYCSQYTVGKEILIFTKLAGAVTDLCSNGSCEIIMIASEAARRRYVKYCHYRLCDPEHFF